MVWWEMWGWRSWSLGITVWDCGSEPVQLVFSSWEEADDGRVWIRPIMRAKRSDPRSKIFLLQAFLTSVAIYSAEKFYYDILSRDISAQLSTGPNLCRQSALISLQLDWIYKDASYDLVTSMYKWWYFRKQKNY